MKIKIIISSVVIFFIFLLSCSDSVNTKDNYAPVIRLITLSKSIRPGEEAVISVDAYDQEGDSLSYSYVFIEGSGKLTPDNSIALVQLDSMNTSIVRVTVTDPKGASASSTIKLYSGNSAPIIYSLSADKDSMSKGESVTLSALASDPDGDDIRYSYRIISGDGTIDTSTENYTATYTSGDTYGEKLIGLRTTDALGAISDERLVKVYVYGSWVKLGSAVTTDPSSTIILKVDSNDIPYIYYKTSAGTHHLKRYSESLTDWETVATPFPSDFKYFKMDFDSNDNLYVSFIEGQDMSFYSFNGTSWSELSLSGLDATVDRIYDLCVTQDDNVCIGYYIIGNELWYIKKYNGSSWESVGPAITKPRSNATFMNLYTDDNNNFFFTYKYTLNYSFYYSYIYFDGNQWCDSSVRRTRRQNDLIHAAFGNNGFNNFVVADINMNYTGYKTFCSVEGLSVYSILYYNPVQNSADFVDGACGLFNSNDEYLIFYITKNGSYFKKWLSTESQWYNFELTSSVTDCKTYYSSTSNSPTYHYNAGSYLRFESSPNDKYFLGYKDTGNDLIIRVFK